MIIPLKRRGLLVLGENEKTFVRRKDNKRASFRKTEDVDSYLAHAGEVSKILSPSPRETSNQAIPHLLEGAGFIVQSLRHLQKEKP